MNAPDRIASPAIPKLLKDPELFQEKGFINGQWVGSSSGELFPVHNPATGELIAQVVNMTTKEAQAAIDAAQAAFEPWKNRTAKDRSAIMRKCFDLITEHTDDLA